MADRFFRTLLRLLPEEFRAAYARDMEATFRSERAGASGRGERLRIWLATVADVLRHAPAVHFDILKRDVLLAGRTLTARPVALTVAVLTLAIGLGANVAMYAVVDTVLLSPLPYNNAHELVMVQETEAGDSSNLGYLSFVDVRDRSRQLTNLVAASQSTATITSPGHDAERVNAMRVSYNYFDLVGVAPAYGRTFRETEDRPGEARRVIILSDGLWRRRFNADPAVVGRTIDLAGIPFQVVGIMPRGFDDIVASRMYNRAEVWTPLGYDPAAPFACRTCRHLRVFGRLSPGSSQQQAENEVSQIIAALEREYPTQYKGAGAKVETLSDVFLGPVRPVLLALWAGVGVLLLIACGNVAHLLLLRASERSQEVAIRTALGVTRARLIRQFLTESVLLALIGGIAGVGLAWAIVQVVAGEGPTQIPRLADVHLSSEALIGAALASLVSGLIFGAAPLVQLLRRDRVPVLASGVRGTDSSSTWRLRATLVGANVALAAVLLVGSGLLVRSLSTLLAIAPGVEPEGVLTAQIWATGDRFRSGDTSDQITTAVQFYDEVLNNIRALPGVTHAAAVTTLPLGGNIDAFSVHVLSREEPSGPTPSADRFTVTPEYFDVLRIPLVRGRYFDHRDNQLGASVAIIGASTAASLFPGQDALGQQITLGPRTAQTRTIVGIVGDVRHHGLSAAVGNQIYVPQAQWAWAETFLTLVIRTNGDPSSLGSAVRESVRRVDPAQPVTQITTYADVIATTTGTRRFAATLLTAFAVASVGMAIVGLYGSVALMVAQRRREIGVRLALGSSRSGIRQLVLSQGLRPVALGLVVGLGLAALSVPALESMLFSVQALDPATFAGAAAALALVGLLACAGPAHRASRIDPSRAVRD